MRTSRRRQAAAVAAVLARLTATRLILHLLLLTPLGLVLVRVVRVFVSVPVLLRLLLLPSLSSLLLLVRVSISVVARLLLHDLREHMSGQLIDELLQRAVLGHEQSQIGGAVEHGAYGHQRNRRVRRRGGSSGRLSLRLSLRLWLRGR